jgi:hypothetical protein
MKAAGEMLFQTVQSTAQAVLQMVSFHADVNGYIQTAAILPTSNTGDC